MSPLVHHLCAPHWREQKEAAFARWQRSGYRDLAAHREFIRLFELLNHRTSTGDRHGYPL
jgi:hypothetical protein